MDKEEARAIARAAVERLAADRGLRARFPFDAVWEYAEQEVPSLQRPAISQYLIKENYLERTGAITRGASSTRAGSPTSEYRLGSHFVAPAPSSNVAESLRGLEAALLGKGFIITAAELANFFLALTSSPLVILAGISGTGKSKLPRLFAELTRSNFHSIPVKPQWSDNSDLFGYTPSLNPNQFIVGNFTKAILEATETPNKMSFVLLDEMNLAAVEHYFSDFLSVIETRRRNGEAIVTDPLPLELPPAQTPDNYQRLRELHLPRNVRVIGTANMDETTHTFSPKVLDRAFTLEFDDPDLTIFATATEDGYDTGQLPALAAQLFDPKSPIAVDEVYHDDSELFDGVAALLEEVKEILKPAGISFGYRPRNDICLYMHFWKRFELAGVLSATAAMDFCFLQKILPKVGGTGEVLGDSMRALLAWLQTDETSETADTDISPSQSRPWKRSAEKVQRMINRLEVESATTYWGA